MKNLKTFSELNEKIYQVPAGDEKMVADYIKSSIEDGVKDIPSIVSNFNMDHDSGVGHDDFRRIAQKFNIKIDMYTSKDGNVRMVLPEMVQVSNNSRLTNDAAQAVVDKLNPQELNAFKQWLKLVQQNQTILKNQNRYNIRKF